MQLWLQWGAGPRLAGGPSAFKVFLRPMAKKLCRIEMPNSPFLPFQLVSSAGGVEFPFHANWECHYCSTSDRSAGTYISAFCTTLPPSFGCHKLDRSQRDGRRCGHITAVFNWCPHCLDTASKGSMQGAVLYWVISSSPNICQQTDLAYRKELDPPCA